MTIALRLNSGMIADPFFDLFAPSLWQGIMIAQGRNDRGIFGVIPQGPEESKICLRVAKIVADGEGSAYISDLLAGKRSMNESLLATR